MLIQESSSLQSLDGYSFSCTLSCYQYKVASSEQWDLIQNSLLRCCLFFSLLVFLPNQMYEGTIIPCSKNHPRHHRPYCRLKSVVVGVGLQRPMLRDTSCWVPHRLDASCLYLRTPGKKETLEEMGGRTGAGRDNEDPRVGRGGAGSSQSTHLEISWSHCSEFSCYVLFLDERCWMSGRSSQPPSHTSRLPSCLYNVLEQRV